MFLSLTDQQEHPIERMQQLVLQSWSATAGWRLGRTHFNSKFEDANVLIVHQVRESARAAVRHNTRANNVLLERCVHTVCRRRGALTYFTPCDRQNHTLGAMSIVLAGVQRG